MRDGESRRIVITGATGFLGSHSVKTFLDGGFYVDAVIRPNSLHADRLASFTGVDVYEVDLSDYASLVQYITHPVDAVIHLAWEGLRGSARNDEALQKRNYEATMEAYSFCVENGCPVFVGVGSQAEYSDLGESVVEDASASPQTAYGRMKLMAYRDVAKAASRSNTRFVWTRIFSLYGPGDFYDSLLSQVVRHLCGVSEIELSSCGQLWNYLHVSDAANALYCLVTQESAQGVYNVASSDTRILRSFVEEAYRVAGSEELPAFGKEMSPGVGFAPSIDKIINTTEWRPSILFEQGILGMIQAQKGKEES